MEAHAQLVACLCLQLHFHLIVVGKSAARFQWSPFFNCLSHVVVGLGIPGTRIKRHKSPYMYMLVYVCVSSYLRHLLFTPFAVATPLRFGAVWLIAQ